jgi:hypothetical protein
MIIHVEDNITSPAVKVTGLRMQNAETIIIKGFIEIWNHLRIYVVRSQDP